MEPQKVSIERTRRDESNGTSYDDFRQRVQKLSSFDHLKFSDANLGICAKSAATPTKMCIILNKDYSGTTEPNSSSEVSNESPKSPHYNDTNLRSVPFPQASGSPFDQVQVFGHPAPGSVKNVIRSNQDCKRTTQPNQMRFFALKYPCALLFGYTKNQSRVQLKYTNLKSHIYQILPKTKNVANVLKRENIKSDVGVGLQPIYTNSEVKYIQTSKSVKLRQIVNTGRIGRHTPRTRVQSLYTKSGSLNLKHVFKRSDRVKYAYDVIEPRCVCSNSDLIQQANAADIYNLQADLRRDRPSELENSLGSECTLSVGLTIETLNFSVQDYSR